MSQYLLFLMLGLSVGTIYAGLTASIVLTYQGTGVINFAAGAMAMVALYVFDDLRAGPALPAVAVGAVVPLVVADVGGARRGARSRRGPRGGRGRRRVPTAAHAPVLAKVIGAIGLTGTISAALPLEYGTELRLREPCSRRGRSPSPSSPSPSIDSG